MATPYTELSGKENPGEKFIYNKFKSKLPDDYLLWHSKLSPIIKREIDFIVFHPNYGVWVIEVKDWVADQILEVGDEKCRINRGGQEEIDDNPLRQAWNNMNLLKDALKKTKSLKHQSGNHLGKFLMPVNYLAIFTNISSSDIQSLGVVNIWGGKQVWTSDFVKDPYVGDDAWEKKLIASREYAFECDLNVTQMNDVKDIIGVPKVVSPMSREVVGTLDDYQERLVRQDINQQILIEGPAGSGKSIVLLKRAIHIHEENPHWQICIICYNLVMANYMRIMLGLEPNARILQEHIKVYDIYDWANKIGLPNIKKYYAEKIFNEDALEAAFNEIGGVRWQYDALLVDEGQDSTDIMIRIYRAMLREQKGSFTFFYDKRQNLYTYGSVVERLKEYGFSIDKEKGLVKQQRSALVLLALIFFEKTQNPVADLKIVIQDVLNLCEKMFFNPKDWIKGIVTGLARLFGFEGENKQIDFKKELVNSVEVVKMDNVAKMSETTVNTIKSLCVKGEIKYGDILILFPSRKPIDYQLQIIARLSEQKIPFIYIGKGRDDSGVESDGSRSIEIGDNRRNAHLMNDAVKVMTIHASKGYDSMISFILGFDGIDALKDDKSAELGYVAITRAKKRCYIYYEKTTPSVRILLDVMRTLS